MVLFPDAYVKVHAEPDAEDVEVQVAALALAFASGWSAHWADHRQAADTHGRRALALEGVRRR